MKTKSKLLLALSALTVGTVAAGATGTYAWFTASRTATMNITNITAQSTRGSLQIGYVGYNVGGQTGLTTVAASGSSQTMTIQNVISDVSSKDGSKFYAPVYNVSDTTPSSFTDQNVTGYVQFAVELKNGGDNSAAVDVYLDPANLEIKGGASGSDLAHWTRVAINSYSQEQEGETGYLLPATGTPSSFGDSNDIAGNPGHLVFMDNNMTTTKDTKINSYVDGLTTSNIQDYDEGDNFYATIDELETEASLPASTSNTSLVTYVGTIKGGQSLYVNVAIWMEGTITTPGGNQNKADGQSVDVKLSFGALDSDYTE